MTIDQFIAKYSGQKNVGNTPDNKGECVGLVMVWLKDQGAPHVWGHAKDLLVNADRNAYQVIPNTPDAVPRAGDVIVWKQGFNATFGHTAVATGKATINTLEVFEQNNPLGSACRVHTYKNYAYIDGWLRPKSAVIAQPTAQQPQITDQTRIPQLGNKEVQQIRSEITAKDTLIKDLENGIAKVKDDAAQFVLDFNAYKQVAFLPETPIQKALVELARKLG